MITAPRAISGVVGGFLATGSAALATSCAPVTPQEHIARAAVIFRGTPARALPALVSTSTGQVKATFKVDQAIKGVSTRTVVVSYVNDGGAMAGWRFATGSQLIFARRQPDGSLALDYCGMVLYYLRHDQRPTYDGLIRAAASKRS